MHVTLKRAFDQHRRKSMVVFTSETHRRVKSIRVHDPRSKLLARIPNKIQASNNLPVTNGERRVVSYRRERDSNTTDQSGQLMSRFSDILLFPLISPLLLPPPSFFFPSFFLSLRFWFEKGPVRGVFIPNSHWFLLRSPVYTWLRI